MKVNFFMCVHIILNRLDLGLTDEDLWYLENEIMNNPDLPPVISGTGGIRKIRIKLPGRGKRGGARVLYVDFVIQKKIVFLTLYAKNQKENLSQAEKKELRELVEILREQL